VKARRLEDIENIDFITSSKIRYTGTPSVYDLEEILQVLQRKYRVDVFFVRHYLKWTMRKAYKDMDLVLKNPWWKPRGLR
jgi:hypothetical protein